MITKEVYEYAKSLNEKYLQRHGSTYIGYDYVIEKYNREHTKLQSKKYDKIIGKLG